MKKHTKKRKGAIFLVALFMMILVFGIAVAISKLSVSDTYNVNMEQNKTKDAYLARSGLEMIYGALIQKIDLGDGTQGSIISRSGPARDSESAKGYQPLPGLERNRIGTDAVMSNVVVPIKFKDSSGNEKEFGKCNITLELFCRNTPSDPEVKSDSPETWYYKITAVGIGDDEPLNKKVNGHKMTMVVNLVNSTNPKIYDGANSY